MSLLSYIFPQTKLITSSKYNKLIRVNEEYGKYKLLVNGSRQSGEYIRKLWQYAFDQFQINKFLQISNILVLGTAGGTVIHLLYDLYPQAKIIGVDIDKVMLGIGQKYFGLDKVKDLSLVNEDAKLWTKRAVKQKLRFDLIIIDLFSGREIPEFVLQKSFLTDLKILLNANGRVVINYLWELKYQQKSEVLFEILKETFTHVSDTRIARNRFFLAKK